MIIERDIKSELPEPRVLAPEEEIRLAADIKWLEEELVRCEAEKEALSMCNIPMNDDLDWFPRIVRRYPDNRIR